MGRWSRELRDASFRVRTAVLTLALLLIFALVLPIGYWLSGLTGVLAALVAGACCWAGGAMAMLIAEVFRRQGNGSIGWLVGMVPRMGIPLGLALIVKVRGGLLFDAGLLYYLLLFYPMALALETFLSLPRTKSVSPDKGT